MVEPSVNEVDDRPPKPKRTMTRQPKRSGLALGAAAIAALLVPADARTQSADALIDKLVEKGVLTTKEANELREETDKNYTTAYSVKTGMADWVTAFKINGDFRGRYEGFFADNPAFVDRSRWRYRMRLGFTAVIKDNLEVGVRFTSGDIDNASSLVAGTDPISGNQSLQNNASKKGVFIDLAYAKWTPLNTAAVVGGITMGKMENPFILSDALFDKDYTPEGLGEQIAWTLNSKNVLNFNAGQFIIDENSSTSDPFMWGVQALLNTQWSKKWSTSVGLSYLSLANVQKLTSASVPDINAGNLRYTSVANNVIVLQQPVYEFGTVTAEAYATYLLDSFPLYKGAFPIKFGGTYLQNVLASDSPDDYGYDVGVNFGKAGKRGMWELSYRYKYLGGDAWFEEVVDSDFGAFYQNKIPNPPPPTVRARTSGYWAGTNVKGNVVKLAYSPIDPVLFSVTWFGTELIQPYFTGTDSKMNRFQVDATFKF